MKTMRCPCRLGHDSKRYRKDGLRNIVNDNKPWHWDCGYGGCFWLTVILNEDPLRRYDAV